MKKKKIKNCTFTVTPSDNNYTVKVFVKDKHFVYTLKQARALSKRISKLENVDIIQFVDKHNVFILECSK